MAGTFHSTYMEFRGQSQVGPLFLKQRKWGFFVVHYCIHQASWPKHQQARLLISVCSLSMSEPPTSTMADQCWGEAAEDTY